MAAVYSTQYQPISNSETCSNAALAVRGARDMVDSLNNAKRYAMCDKILSHVSPLGTTSANSGSVAEVVVLMFAPRSIPQGFTDVWFEAGVRPANGDGMTTWRLYSMPTKYRGAAILDTGMLPSGSTNASVISDASVSNAHSRPMNTLPIVVSTDDTSWLMVTAENNAAASYGRLYTIDAWPVMP